MSTFPSSSNNQELKHIINTGPALVWFPKINGIWKGAMLHINPHNLGPAETPHCFTLPPCHLFWGGNEENQHTFFHHFFVLHAVIREHILEATVAIGT
jgi:hypothetical protein